MAYTLSLGVHGNGFIAAFVLRYRLSLLPALAGRRRASSELLDDLSFLLTAAMWFVFGGLRVDRYWRPV